MSNEINPMAFFQEPSVADLRLLACPGAEELTKLIDQHLVEWAKSAGVEKDSFIIPCECPRFQSGDAKGLVRESVRGDDIFIVIDPGNYSVTYNLFGYENHLSPDDHFANLKRLIHDGEELAGVRGDVLWGLDRKAKLRNSYENPSIEAIYRDYLGEPLSERAEELLHTDHFAWSMH